MVAELLELNAQLALPSLVVHNTSWQTPPGTWCLAAVQGRKVSLPLSQLCGAKPGVAPDSEHSGHDWFKPSTPGASSH